MMMAEVSISRALLKEMQTWIEGCMPEEACGLVVGNGSEVEEIIPITNHLHAPNEYSMDPGELLQALESIDAGNRLLMGIFHSHPNGPEHPSERDLQQRNYPEVSLWIWSKNGNEWRLMVFQQGVNRCEPMRIVENINKN